MVRTGPFADQVHWGREQTGGREKWNSCVYRGSAVARCCEQLGVQQTEGAKPGVRAFEAPVAPHSHFPYGDQNMEPGIQAALPQNHPPGGSASKSATLGGFHAASSSDRSLCSTCMGKIIAHLLLFLTIPSFDFTVSTLLAPRFFEPSSSL